MPDPSDYPLSKTPSALRSIRTAEKEACDYGKHVERFILKLVDGPLP